jgi:small-conductance mechanosensitive channel
MKARRALTGATIVTLIWIILLMPACAPATPTPGQTAPASPVSGGTTEASPPPQRTQDRRGGAAGISTAVAARTPIPTPTRTNIEQRFDSFANRTGLGGRSFLGISASAWLELAGALLTIVAGYFVVRLLVNQILKRIVGRTKAKLDDEILAEIANELRWFLLLILADFIVSGLSFLHDRLRTAVNDLLFLLWLTILTSMVLGLIRVAANHYKANLTTQEDRKRLDPVIIAIQRIAYFFVLILALSIGLAHFGANTNALYFTVLITGLILSLAARDIITDAISGFIILADQPFREGDSVHIKAMDTWGDVLEIGTRSTRIRTVDNRELIVPNSQIAKSQIVNYNYPDTKYRMRSDFRIAYGIDMDRVRKTATEAVRGVEGVLDDEPVDVLFIEFEDSARKIRVRWWIATFHDQWHALDKVNAALESAFEKAGIDMPYETYDLRMQIEDGGGIVSRPKPAAPQEDREDDRT